MKIYFFFVGIVINLNILQIYPNCNPHNVIGVCRAYWAYTISDLVTIQKCIKNDGILEDKYSPQVLINNVVQDNNQECYVFNKIESMENGLKYAQVMGIGKESETPDVSYYLGVKDNKYLGQEFSQKIKTFDVIQAIEVEREILENQITPIIVMRNSIELMFDDVSAKGLVKGNVGFDVVKDQKVFILKNNFNDNWTNNGFTQINQDDPNIVKIYKVDINQFQIQNNAIKIFQKLNTQNQQVIVVITENRKTNLNKNLQKFLQERMFQKKCKICKNQKIVHLKYTLKYKQKSNIVK